MQCMLHLLDHLEYLAMIFTSAGLAYGTAKSGTTSCAESCVQKVVHVVQLED
jgi:hypothetical protein